MEPIFDLTKTEGNWTTEMGGSFPGERVVVRGKSLFNDLGDFSWLKLLLYIITGREFGNAELEVLDKIWAQTISYPDPRVWNNRIAALAGTVRSTGALGISAGSAATEAKVYGGQATIASFDFLMDCANRIELGQSLDEVLKKELKINRAIYGYGRPIVSNDERINPIQKLIKKFGYDNGKYVCLAYQIEDALVKSRFRLKMNIAGLAAAIAADMGMSAEEYYLWLVNGYNAGITACYLDASSKSEGALFPLRCNRINYTGLDKRTWK